ncbi:ABC transport system, periplasmic component [Haemophilus influenzae]|nr:substrate-binding domain-containing protein [Haemophilus influenzae]MCK8845303.1 substrate-binding domain-containing protein [Haemophilus influenzae]MCK8936632.1 substrate-binding domain-containing protein [Haemophilus influenzae]MCK8965730.1 substrate-binding domain-containing protein [Haemophilus influenzae]MCK8979614.1 substrate-binding domain-containing protein [Haemophilus influenzae]MCK8993972.1 substrate-binding domain-containing protein [Haemophilus influenzae]
MRILAAGSLRQPFTLWQQALIQQYHLQVEIEFGPAGLLCQRIEQGEKVDLFASANDAHPRHLQARYPHIQLVPFATNRLCLIAKKSVITHHDENWLTLLMSPHLRLEVSTPKADPCGDYTLALFSNIEKRHMGYGSELKEKAMAIVGGPDSITIPTGRNTAEWLFEQNYADLFIGYASNH